MKTEERGSEMGERAAEGSKVTWKNREKAEKLILDF